MSSTTLVLVPLATMPPKLRIKDLRVRREPVIVTGEQHADGYYEFDEGRVRIPSTLDIEDLDALDDFLARCRRRKYPPPPPGSEFTFLSLLTNPIQLLVEYGGRRKSAEMIEPNLVYRIGAVTLTRDKQAQGGWSVSDEAALRRLFTMPPPPPTSTSAIRAAREKLYKQELARREAAGAHGFSTP